VADQAEESQIYRLDSTASAFSALWISMASSIQPASALTTVTQEFADSYNKQVKDFTDIGDITRLEIVSYSVGCAIHNDTRAIRKALGLYITQDGSSSVDEVTFSTGVSDWLAFRNSTVC
jgi:hypothetical protein